MKIIIDLDYASLEDLHNLFAMESATIEILKMDCLEDDQDLAFHQINLDYIREAIKDYPPESNRYCDTCNNEMSYNKYMANQGLCDECILVIN